MCQGPKRYGAVFFLAIETHGNRKHLREERWKEKQKGKKKRELVCVSHVTFLLCDLGCCAARLIIQKGVACRPECKSIWQRPRKHEWMQQWGFELVR